MVEANCTIGYLAGILGRKWTIEIIYYLQDRLRFCELQSKLGNVNPTTLSKRLKFLEAEGLIRRYRISDMPPRVEYELTERGHDLGSVLDAMRRWGKRWLPRAN